jgi:hypothetical protein
MSDRPRIFRLGEGPSPEATRMETQDVLLWDDRNEWCEVSEWPTRGFRTYYLSPPLSSVPPTVSPTRHLAHILDAGWAVASCSVVQHGFLWLKQARVWTFTRRVEWLRDGSEESFVGSRVTPSMFKDEDEGRHWVDLD